MVIRRKAEASEASSSTNLVSFYLPFDIIKEIMLRLPIKSLMRFKLVSKTWYALIQDPVFVKKYQVTGPVITSILLLSGDWLYLTDEDIHSGNWLDLQDKKIKLDFLVPPEEFIHIVNICGGLICVAYDYLDYDYIIGNPAIREFRRIPKSKLPKSNLVFHGFSSFSDEYKLVRIVYYYVSTGEVEVKADVYAMRTDIWVEIDVKMGYVDNLGHLIDFDGSADSRVPVVLNDIFYWEAASSMDDMRVVSFDISAGLFDQINVPINLVTMDAVVNNRWKILEYEEKLSFIICCGDRRFDLWVLDENRTSWTWKLRINSIPIVEDPAENYEDEIEVIKYTKSGELLVRDWYNGTDSVLLLYNLSSRETTILSCLEGKKSEEDDAEEDDFESGIYFYTESLRTVKRRNDVKEAD